MRIVTGRQMAEIDRTAIEERGIPSLALMERAGWCVAAECHRLCADPQTPIVVLCGKGNNGGDGFVAARHLQGWGYHPRVLLSDSPESLSPDGRTNWERYRKTPWAQWRLWAEPAAQDWFEDRPVVVDALLGTGFRGIVSPPYSTIIQTANENSRWALGADIASGVDADSGQSGPDALHCQTTVTFGLPKKGHFLREGLDHTGRLVVVDIGFPPDLIQNAPGMADLITGQWAVRHIPVYSRSAHKGLRGRTLLVAGSPGFLGAAILAAKAALKSGTGLVTLALPRSLNAAAKSALPEVMTYPLPETKAGNFAFEGLANLLAFAGKMDSAAIGPGLGQEAETQHLAAGFIRECPVPVVVDADGLNALAASSPPEILNARTAATVLTPHPGEMGRLLGGLKVDEVEAQRWELAARASEDWRATVLLKGAATVVASGGEVLKVNRTGHPAMAQGGMGDALTGILLSLLGQGLRPHDAACLAAYWHGRAGDWAALSEGPLSATADCLIDHLGLALQEIMDNSQHHQKDGALLFDSDIRKGTNPNGNNHHHCFDFISGRAPRGISGGLHPPEAPLREGH
jgi:NAD(P)H-hydrate epimerase